MQIVCLALCPSGLRLVLVGRSWWPPASCPCCHLSLRDGLGCRLVLVVAGLCLALSGPRQFMGTVVRLCQCFLALRPLRRRHSQRRGVGLLGAGLAVPEVPCLCNHMQEGSSRGPLVTSPLSNALHDSVHRPELRDHPRLAASMAQMAQRPSASDDRGKIAGIEIGVESIGG